MTEPPRILANTRSTQLAIRFHTELGEQMDPFGTQATYTKTDWPEWLIKRLDRAGWIDAATGANRQARAVRCGCGAHVIRGLTEFPMAISVDADPHPLTALGEAVCVYLRWPTYELRYLAGGTYDLDIRDQFRRRERPAGVTRQVDVLAAHRCGNCPPPPWAPTMLHEPDHVTPPEEAPY